ncbi:unnamed protein product [Peronospora farinosa]|uniref:Uncharacterized protein n=1 Tax=Peronospora farinosa TaxID=134698 RepID=A0AAV0TVX2_9STRA|nr:unnamed protein product [Peronospora farinosa]
MQKLISSRSCIRMIRVFITVLVLVVPATSHESAASTNSTPLNVTDYWIEDHPYVFQPYWKRLRNGKIVLENDSTFSSVRDTVRTNTSWISRWVLSSEGQRTLRKDLSRLLMYNLVSPMDYGDSLRSSNVRRRRNKAVRMFLTDNLALPALKTFGRVAWNLIQSHYVDYFKDEMFTQRLKTMNASEMIREFNLTLPIEAIEEIPDEDSRPNTTQAYEYDGEKSELNCTDSTPQLLIHTRITRTMSQLLQSLAVQNVNIAELDTSSSGSSDDAILSSCPSSCAENDRISRELANVSDELLLSALNLSVPANGSVSTGAVNHGGNTTMSTKDTQAFKQIQVRLEEFYFDTGIPRLPVHPNVTNLVFPSLATFLRVSLTTDASTNHSAASEDSVANNSFGDSNDAVIPRSLSLEDLISDDAGNIGSMTDFSSRSGVYAALTHYYAFPSADKWMIKKFDDENISDCTLKQVCLVHSGVTVYTPSLTALQLVETFNDMSVAPTTKRLMRLMALLEMVQVAFEAERRALKHGLQGPSTVWYSTHDLDVDEFADAVLGTINMSISGDTGDSTPLHVFEKHMNERVPILDEEVSYYAETNHDTKFSMELNHSIPMLDKFQESDLVKLVSSFTNEMKNLNRAIGFYVETRSTDLLYQEVVSATTRGDLYNGSEYTLIGFGFLIPATNKHNVLYRDMKLPVPFHLVVRLLVRFQESRLLLPQESRQVLVCLTMAYYNISFYRCHNSSSTNH